MEVKCEVKSKSLIFKQNNIEKKSIINISLDYIKNNKIKNINKIKQKNNNYKLTTKIKTYKMKKKIKLSINNEIFFFLRNFILINLIYIILSEKQLNNSRKLQTKSSIKLKVSYERIIKVINTWFLPDRIYINDINTSIDNTGRIILDNEGINNITMEWDIKFTSLEKMFQNLGNIIEIDLSNLDSSSVTSMKTMFYNCKDVEYINFYNLNTSSVNNMSSMFEGCISLLSLDLSNFDTSNVKYMDSMFKDCMVLTHLNLSSFKTPKLQKMNDMFSGCISLKSIELNNFDTSLVNDMSLLFEGCITLSSLNLSNFRTQKVKNMNSIFMFCTSLESLDISNFDTSSVTDMKNMFSKCFYLISLNLSHFITSKVKSMDYMFNECLSLKSLDLSSNFQSSKLESMEYMFNECKSLKSLDLSNFSLSKKKLKSLFNGCKSLTSIKFYKSNSLKGSIDNMFSRCSALKSIDLKYFDFSLTTSMEYLFQDCISLSYLDLSNINASLVTSMSNMFEKCESLKHLNLTNFTTLSVTNLESMFSSCSSLISLDLQKFKTSNVTKMGNLFFSCIQLISLNLSNFNTSLVVDMNSMFRGCISLNSLDISNFDTSLVTDMTRMFYGCTKLSSLNLSLFNMKSVLSLENMFYECSELKYINFQNYSNELSPNIHDIFYGTDDNLIIFINKKANIENLLSELSDHKCIYRKPIKDFRMDHYKIIYNNRNCIKKCSLDETYKYEFKEFCFEECPEGTHSSKDNLYLCENNIYECVESYPYLYIEDNKCEEDCNCIDFFEDICTINNVNEESENEIISNIINGISEGLIDKLLEKVINKPQKDIIKIVNNTLYQITSSFNQNNKSYNNISSIKLGQCENILKEKYNLFPNETLIIFKTEHIEEGLLIPLIYYEIFNPITKEKLNLDYCRNENINIDILIPVSINDIILFKYDPKNEYYNDICYNCKINNNSIDLTLYDRQFEFNINNLSLCTKNCNFNGYDSLNKIVICNCKIQDRIKLSSEIKSKDLLFKFDNKPKITNLELLKCYNLLLSKEGLIKNIGNYIVLLVLLLYIGSAIFFYKKGYDLLLIQINDLLKDQNQILENESNNNLNGKNYEPKIRENSTNLSSLSKVKNQEKNNLTNNMKKLDLIGNKNILNTKDFEEKKETINMVNINYIDYEINTIPYQEAIEKDKRTFFQYYISLIKLNHILIFTFNPSKDYNSFIIKICLFAFSLVSYIAINTLFFNDYMMHKIYKSNGTLNFYYVLPQIIYSVIISSIIETIVKKLSLTQDNILSIKHEKNDKKIKGKIISIIKCLIIKYTCFFILGILFLILFWYYISCFCAIYKKTQVYLIKNTLISYLISLIAPLFYYLIPGIFRIASLKKPGECLYKLSQFFQLD